MGMAQSMQDGATKLRWVHSDAMLANSLTKKGERWQIENYYRGQCSWKLIHDERFMSAKNRRKL
eukprot:14863648-Alexandrium_andersonii.AAC.1